MMPGIDRDRLDPLALDGGILEAAAIEKHHFRARFASCRGDAAIGVRLGRRMAGVIADLHGLRARLEAEPDDGGHDFRIGVGGLLRSAVPTDVGLDPHHRALADETPQPAEGFDGLLGQLGGNLVDLLGPQVFLARPARDGHVERLCIIGHHGRELLRTQGQDAGGRGRMNHELSA